MKLRVFDDPQQFSTHVEPYLMAHEAEHCLLLGILGGVIRNPGFYAEMPYMAFIENADQVVAVAMRTPPARLLLSIVSDLTALSVIADALCESNATVPGVFAPKAVAAAFAEYWTKRTGRLTRLAFNERVYRLDKVSPVHGVAGGMREATISDAALLVDWLIDFTNEALPIHAISREDAERSVNLRFDAPPDRAAWRLWIVDNQPVAMAGFHGRTPNAARLGPVYTPPQFRKRGYGSALTAALSQEILDTGRQFVTLFTDLANPTSNHIYQQIGYQPVLDWDEYLFDQGESHHGR